MPALKHRRDGSALDVRAEKVDSAIVVDLEGRLTVEADTHRLDDLVRSATGLDVRHVVLDLGHVGQLDCSGIGRLVQLRNQVCARGSTFTLVNVERRQRKLLELAGLLAVFTVFDSRQEALTWCRNSAAAARGLSFRPLEGIASAGCPAA